MVSPCSRYCVKPSGISRRWRIFSFHEWKTADASAVSTRSPSPGRNFKRTSPVNRKTASLNSSLNSAAPVRRVSSRASSLVTGFRLNCPSPDEDGAGDYSIHGTEQCERAFLEMEGRRVPGQREIVEAKGLAQADLAQLPIDRIRVGESQTLSGNGDVHLRFGDGKSKLQGNRGAQVDCLY